MTTNSDYVERDGYIVKSEWTDFEHVVNNVYIDEDNNLYLGSLVDEDPNDHNWDGGDIHKLQDMDMTGVIGVLISIEDDTLGVVSMDDGTHHVINMYDEDTDAHVTFRFPDIEFNNISYYETSYPILESDGQTIRLVGGGLIVYGLSGCIDLDFEVSLFEVTPSQLDIILKHNILGNYRIVCQYLIKDKYEFEYENKCLVTKDDIAYWPVTRLYDGWTEEDLVSAIDNYEDPRELGSMSNIIEVKEHKDQYDSNIDKWSVSTTDGIFLFGNLSERFLEGATYVGDTDYIQYKDYYIHINSDDGVIEFKPPCNPISYEFFDLQCGDILIKGKYVYNIHEPRDGEPIGDITMYKINNFVTKSAGKRT